MTDGRHHKQKARGEHSGGRGEIGQERADGVIMMGRIRALFSPKRGGQESEHARGEIKRKSLFFTKGKAPCCYIFSFFEKLNGIGHFDELDPPACTRRASAAWRPAKFCRDFTGAVAQPSQKHNQP